jgi:hypothetical protein
MNEQTTQKNVGLAADLFHEDQLSLKKTSNIFDSSSRSVGNEIKTRLNTSIQIVTMGFIQNEPKELTSIFLI